MTISHSAIAVSPWQTPLCLDPWQKRNKPTGFRPPTRQLRLHPPSQRVKKALWTGLFLLATLHRLVAPSLARPLHPSLAIKLPTPRTTHPAIPSGTKSHQERHQTRTRQPTGSITCPPGLRLITSPPHQPGTPLVPPRILTPDSPTAHRAPPISPAPSSPIQPLCLPAPLHPSNPSLPLPPSLPPRSPLTTAYCPRSPGLQLTTAPVQTPSSRRAHTLIPLLIPILTPSPRAQAPQTAAPP